MLYRITWRSEIFLEADNKEDLEDKWHEVDIQNLREEVTMKRIPPQPDYTTGFFVEVCSREEVE